MRCFAFNVIHHVMDIPPRKPFSGLNARIQRQSHPFPVALPFCTAVASKYTALSDFA